MEPPGKILLFSLYLIICGIPLQEYLKMRVKKVNILRTLNSKALIQLKLLFSIDKNSIFYLCPNVIRFLENSFIRAENFRMWISGLRLNPLFFLISKLNIVRKTHDSD